MEETQSSGSEVPEQCNNFTDTSREPSNLATSSNILSCKSSAKTDPIIVIDQNAVSESDSDSESDNNVDEAEIRIDKQKTNSGNEDQFIASTNRSFSDSSIISSVEPNGSNNLAKTNNPIAEGTVRNLIPADSSLCNLLVYGSSSDEEEDDVDSENEQSSDSYSCDSDNAQNDEVEIVQSSTSQIPKPTKVRKISASVGKTIKSMGELSLNDLPPVPDLSTIQIDDVSIDECDEMGKIASVVDTLVMVESFPNKPAYDVNTLLFLNGGRQPLGYIFDVIGPVAAPMYAIRFNSAAEIDLLNISRGVKVFSAPKNTKHTQYVFVQQLLASKGTDASWKEDNELPGQDSSDIDGVEVPSDFEPDFSDDERELEAARQRRFQNQRGGSKAAAALMASSRRLKYKRNSLERHRTFEKDMNVRNLMDTNIHRLRESYYEATAAPPMQKRHAPNHQYRQHMHQPPIAPPPPPPPRHGFPPIPATFGPMPPPFPPPPCSYPHPQMGPAPPPFAAVVNHPPPFMGMGPPPPLPPPTFQVPPAAFLSRLGPPSVGPPRSMNPFAVVGPQLPHRFGMAGGGNAVGQWKPCGDPIGPGGPYHHAMVDMKMRPPHQLAVAAAAAAAAVNSAPRFMYMTGVQQQQPPPPPPGTAAGFLFYDPRAAPMRPWQPLQRPPPHQYHQHQYHQHNQKTAPGPGGQTAASATTSHYYHKRS